MWPDRRVLDLFKIELPIVLAPMAGAMDFEMAVAVAQAGGLGSVPCAMLTPDKVREQIAKFRERTDAPLNLNFFCHTPPVPNNAREARWRERLSPYYAELGIDPAAPMPTSNRAPFDAAFCAVVEEIRAAVVSFHFGLPAADLLARVKAAGCLVLELAPPRWQRRAGWKSAASMPSIAQGYEAGGHRGMFLTDDVAAQVGTFALGAAGRRCRESAGDRRRRRQRRARHRGGLRARCGRRADRQRLSALSGIEDFRAASRRAEGAAATTAPRSPIS